VVWFGESIPTQALEQSFRALEMCDTLIVVGTSGAVYPVASFPETVKSNGGFVIEVNTEATPISHIADVGLYGRAGEIMPALVNAWQL
jgi:NAD-dependent deacetylase